MDMSIEIARQAERLPPDQQQRVLQFITSLSTDQEAPTLTDQVVQGGSATVPQRSKALPKGKPGTDLLQFSGWLDDVSAQEMRQAIEEECERVDSSEW